VHQISFGIMTQPSAKPNEVIKLFAITTIGAIQPLILYAIHQQAWVHAIVPLLQLIGDVIVRITEEPSIIGTGKFNLN